MEARMHPAPAVNACFGDSVHVQEGYCGDVKESDLTRLHNDAIKHDPFISKAIGPNAKIERMRAASLRVGGQGLRTTVDDHLIIVGEQQHGSAPPLSCPAMPRHLLQALQADGTHCTALEQGLKACSAGQ